MIKLTAAAATAYASVTGKLDEHMPMVDLISTEAIAAVLISVLMLPLLRRVMD